MTRQTGSIVWRVVALGLILGGWASAPAAAHAEAAQAAPSDVRVYRMTGARLGVGRNITVARDEEVRDAVVVIGGSLRVDGRVRDGIFVAGGDVTLGPESDVRGDIVLVGGTLTRAEGAQLRGAVSDVRVGDWRPSWPDVRVAPLGATTFGRWIGLAGTLFRMACLVILMGLILILARGPVARVGRAASVAPGRAMVVGLVAELLFAPVLIIASVALAVTIIGIPFVVILVPVAITFGVVALLFGFTAMACGLGEWFEDRAGVRGHSAFLAAIIGLLAIVGPTLLARLVGVAPEPLRWAAFALLIAGGLIEFFVWTIGLGATLMTGFGRSSGTPPPIPAA